MSSTSSPSLSPNFDPFQVFEVEHRQCLLFHVTVLKGRNITKGWFSDLLDTPDPYVQLKIKTAAETKKRTKAVDNDKNPVWNEKFTFFMDIKERNILEISLMESNYVKDDVLGTTYFNISDLTLDQVERRTFIFNGNSEVDLEMKVEFDPHPTLRYSLCLSDEEKTFLEARKMKVYHAMNRMLGKHGPRDPREVPTIGILGSGGGFRAMTGLCGVFKALVDSGIMDMVTYTAGLSGSAWYISTLYSHPDFPERTPGDLKEELKRNIDSSLMWILTPQSIYRYLDRIIYKRRQGQPVSFTDFFGHLVGETLLKGRLDSKLTDQQEKIKDGRAPMPLYTCVHVKKDVSAKVFQEWVEFSPYEMGMPKYGTFLKTRLFGSKFFMGHMVRQYEESPLHFIQGIWGSAFSILFRRLLDDNRKMDPVEMVRRELELEIDDDYGSDSDSSEEESSDEFKESSEPPKKKRKVSERSQKKHDHEEKRKGVWQGFIEGLFSSDNILNNRTGRAAMVHNFMRGLSLNRSYPITPWAGHHFNSGYNFGAPETPAGTFTEHFESLPTHNKCLYMVDGGLTFNSPYPLLLRPQRGVDILLSFDFSARPSDSSPPFKEVLLAERWARMHNVPFPPIDTSVFDREGMKELYIFKHPTDPYCPIVLHFVLVNMDFRKYKRPGVKRKTQAEKDFANFDIFDDENTPYGTFNFKYEHEAFERLSQLTEFNTLLNLDKIKQTIIESIKNKREHGPAMFFKPESINLLPIKSPLNRRKLRNYLRSMEEERAMGSKNEEESAFPFDENSDDVTDSRNLDDDTFIDPDSTGR